MTTSSEISSDTARIVNSSCPLSLENPGDVLAVVQHVFGRLPHDSLVIIGLRDGTTGGHLRVDLEPAYQQPVEMARKCTEWIAGYRAKPAPEAAIALVFAGQRSKEGRSAIGNLVEELAEGLDIATELGLLGMWWVEGGGIRSFWDPEGPAQDTGELLDETLQRVPQLRPVRAMSPQELTAAFCAPNPLIDAALIHRMRSFQPWRAPSAEKAMEHWLRLWKSTITDCLAAGGAEFLHQPGETAAGLLGSLEDLNTLSALLVSAAENPHTGDVPDWERVEALDAILYELYPYTESVARENLLGLKAWVEWSKGNGSTASEFCTAAAALRCEVGEEKQQTMGELVERLQSALGVCPWAQVKRLSYGWWKSQ